MIRAIIFDLDGVIIDSEIFYMQQIIDMAEKEFQISLNKEQLYPLAGGNHVQQKAVLTPIMNANGIPYETFETKLNTFYKQNPIDYTKLLDPEVKDVLKWIKAKGFKTMIASSSSVENINEVLRTCNLTPYFDDIMSGNMFKESKPNPEIYITCVQHLNLKDYECIAIEDSEYGIEAAKRAGLTCIAKYDNRFSYNQEKADYKVINLIEIIDIIKEINT
ncbi:HAD superfamily hydrolase (TIGR01509 family) [Breznakia sp. PF5-3]|uniref:HAD family hydrolase n=1 Tax=unclassified Breznakia TaxID=2623764 RepID=UPI00240743E7|nr:MULTISPECIES: HAD family phosphatase [unclassified Breznakia]MDF9824765.1 HAD superfamily hydrolase (TIGR01509 family) [Breznakia sp. PM6-1]MDF9835668.1 HAD superfamily hydrolase (TIGR01509 family) [Breznakia sp. PF5-3]MDF9837717.1 HAD superfamily hydrolase (TIGR01509 family) [Breznakia sp. PFB2-8]MDF9859678.1 HAD superfamily hydrolase (TIGR01509 family) [Breznakia sp. PH5-24]